MANNVRTIIGEVEVHQIPVQVEVPVYKKVEKPEYVLVKEEVVYEVPKILYEEKTYERPKFVEKEYEIPVYREKVYEVPVYVEKVYEVPVIKEVEKIVEVPVIKEIQKLIITDVPKEVEVIRYKEVYKEVINAVIRDREVTNAIIKNVTVEALHPKYICGNCKKEVVDAS